MPSFRPFFSIIIPSYNSAKHIISAIKSIKDQTFGDYEILLIDNNSDDNSLELVIDNFKEGTDKLRWISEPDQGIYDAMNKGIKLSKGKWLYFLGSDDQLFSDDVLEKVASMPDLDDYDIIYGSVLFDKSEEVYDGPFNAIKLISRNISHQAIFFKREVFEKLGLFDLKYPIGADYYFNIRWWNDERFKRKYIPVTIARFGMNGTSNTQTDSTFNRDFDQIIRNNFKGIPLFLYKLRNKRGFSRIINKIWKYYD